METTRTITGTTGKGLTAEYKITMTVSDKISYSDGWNINLGNETLLSISVSVDSKHITSSAQEPRVLDARYDKRGLAARAYARVGNLYINQARYEEIMAVIAEMTTPEIKAEVVREQPKTHAQPTELCPKCHTYCYGDCEA